MIVDVSAGLRMTDRWQALFRPWFRLPRPSTPTAPAVPWEKQIWQAGVRYERPGAIVHTPRRRAIWFRQSDSACSTTGQTSTRRSFRISAYLVPMLPFDPTVPREAPVSSSYPLGRS